MTNVKRKFETTKKAVRFLLSRYEECRNDDRALIIYFWYYMDRLPVFLPKPVICRLTSPETIRRARQKIQSEGELLPTDSKIIQRRKIRRHTIRNYFARLNDEKIPYP